MAHRVDPVWKATLCLLVLVVIMGGIVSRRSEAQVRLPPNPRLRDPRLRDPRLRDPRLQDPRLQDPRLQDPRLQDPRLRDPRLRNQRVPNQRQNRRQQNGQAAAANNRQPVQDNANRVQLSQGIRNFVEQQLIPAYNAQQSAYILQTAQTRLARATDEQIQEIDRLLKQNDAPSLAAILTDARLQTLKLAGRRAPKSSLIESILVIGEVQRRLDEFLQEIESNPIMKDPLPKPKQLGDFRDLLWTTHVDRNRLLVAKQLVGVGRMIQRKKGLSRTKNLSEERKEILKTDFRKTDRRFRNAYNDLEERSLELRVKRIGFAVRILTRSESPKDRFLAAYAVGVDGPDLIELLDEDRGKFNRSFLNEVDLDTLEAEMHSGVEKAGDLVAKSRLLFAGLHWWRRGRYGSGPIAMGLIKGPAAATNAGARIGLFMPTIAPTPSDPMKAKMGQIPTFDRRHHYSWAFQDRDFREYMAGQTQEVAIRDVNDTFQGGHFDGTIEGQFW